MSDWLPVPEEHPFGLHNLPYGVFSTGEVGPRVGVRVGDWVLDAGPAAERAGMESGAVWLAPSLNPFLALGRPAWVGAREWLTDLLTSPERRDCVEPFLLPLGEVTMHLPVQVGDLVDFYASEHHAANIGRMFRPGREPLTPNWRHLPLGYHGRSGTVVVSGTDVARPRGQWLRERLPEGEVLPEFGASRRLDFEAELGFVVGGATPLGQPVPVEAAEDHLFGVVLLNDWSARDIHAWEHTPLGPFLGKSFATSISSWVVTLDALAAARVALPGQQPEPLPYLTSPEELLFGLDVHLEVEVNGTVVSRPEYRSMYWSPVQLLAHLTVGGASLRDGDLVASGTVSGPEPHTRGSLLELSWDGTEPVTLDDGSTRSFLEDEDVVTVRGWAPGPGDRRTGLGEVTGRVVGPR